jgi:hypothetical protein
MVSSGGEKVPLQIIPISISTSHPTHEMVLLAARTAARAEKQNLRHRVAMKRTLRPDKEESLTPQKTRRAKVEAGNIYPEVRAAPKGHGGIGDPFVTRLEDAKRYLHERKLSNEARAGGPNVTGNDAMAWEDRLVVSHPEPNLENRKSLVVPGALEILDYNYLTRSMSKEIVSSPRSPPFDERAGIVRVSPASSNSFSPIGARSLPIGGRSSPLAIRNASSITGLVSRSSVGMLTGID